MKMPTKTRENVQAPKATLTVASVHRFLRGEMTWAELIGVGPLAYASGLVVGRHLYQEGRLVEARTLLEALSRANPRNAIVWTCLGAVYQTLDEDDLAVDAYDRALMLDPETPEALLNRGELALHRGETLRAMDDLRRVAELQDNSQPIVERARVLLRKIGQNA
jgi:Flp pilus assembly protein TadD